MSELNKQIKLSINPPITILDYLELEKEKKKKKISEFIYGRFTERYITPLTKIDKKYKNGFCIMANCCLLIEAFESFYRGWDDTKNKRGEAFCKFFTRVNEFNAFASDDLPTIFYKNIRCGILHQAETTGGWRIQRKGDLLNKEKLIINANKFLDNLYEALLNYKKQLNDSEWESEVWKNFRKKMKSIIRNCESGS